MRLDKFLGRKGKEIKKPPVVTEWAIRLTFSSKTTEEQLVNILRHQETDIGREIPHKHNIAKLLLEFAKGKEEIIAFAYKRHGSRLKEYVVPDLHILFNEHEYMPAGGYSPLKNTVFLNFKHLEQVAADDIYGNIPLYDFSGKSSTVQVEISALDFYLNLGREEYDHSLDYFLHGDDNEEYGEISLVSHDSKPFEYRAIGKQILLAQKAGENPAYIEFNRTRLKNALPHLKQRLAKKRRD